MGTAVVVVAMVVMVFVVDVGLDRSLVGLCGGILVGGGHCCRGRGVGTKRGGRLRRGDRRNM